MTERNQRTGNSSGKREGTVEVLRFCLDGEVYAIETVSVQEIIKMFKTTFVPGTPSYIKGIVPVRGTVMPVFDLHERLGLSPFLKEKLSRFVICQAGKGSFAIMVDRVLDVVQLDGNQMEDSSQSVVLNGSGYVKGTARYKGRLLILVDFEKISTLN